MSKLLHWKKCLACLLAFALCAALLCVGAGASAQSAFTLGDGTEDNPYQIQTVDQLKAVADDLDAHYILVDDLDLGGESSPWTPIGSFSPYAPFTGTFDGGGHTISGLYIDGNSSNRGLFGYVGSGGTVKNLNVSGSVTGGYNVGGVVGNNSGGTVESCGSSCSVDGHDFVGGVVGRNNGGTVTGCFNTGSVNSTGGSSYAGGVVGDNMSGGTVSYCYNTGTVSGGNSVGGVVGYNHGSNVSSCYNAGSVTSNASHTGGVVGRNISGVVSNCYNTGKITNKDSNDNVGGILGSSDKGAVTHCYNIGKVEGDIGNYFLGSILGNNSGAAINRCYFLAYTANRGVGAGNTDGTEMLYDNSFSDTSTKFTGWDFGGTWVMSNGFADDSFTRSVLLYNCESTGVIFSGSGEADDPYKIPNLATLEDYRDKINNDEGSYRSASYVLTANIDLGGEGSQWTPICPSQSSTFAGTFDGDGHTISGLYINNSSNVDLGLFGRVSGTVMDLTVYGSVTGNSVSPNAGGVAGFNRGTVTGCTSRCDVTVYGSSASAGGVVGWNSSGTVSSCISSGNITGNGDSSNAGGIVGWSNNSDNEVRDCINTGNITCTAKSSNAGGIVGSSDGSTISGCTNYGTEMNRLIVCKDGTV